MEIRRAGVGVVAAVGVGLLGMAASPAARAQVKLEYKFPEGKTLTYKSTVKTQPGADAQRGWRSRPRPRRRSSSSQAIGKRRGDSTLPVEEKIESLHATCRLRAASRLTYDSKDPDAKIDNEQFKFLGRRLKLAGEIAYTVVLDGQNKVKAIEGTEKLLEKADKLDPHGPRTRSAASSRPTSSRSSSSRSIGNLPDGPGPARRVLGADRDPRARRRPGRSASARSTSTPAPRRRGTRRSTRSRSKVLEVEARRRTPTTESPLKVTKSDLKVESSEGTILFDREAGCVVEARGKFHIKGSMTYKIMRPGAPRRARDHLRDVAGAPAREEMRATGPGGTGRTKTGTTKNTKRRRPPDS